MTGFGLAVLGNEAYLIGSAIAPNHVVHIYDFAKDEWRRGPQQSEPRFGLTAAAVGGKIYVFSGMLPGALNHRFIRSWDVLDPATETWTFGGEWSERAYAGSAVLDGRIYMVGGRGTAHVNVATGEFFDPAKRNGEELAPMAFALGQPGVAALDGKLFVAGGMLPKPGTEYGEPSRELLVFDPTRGWETRAPMRLGRGFAGAAALRGVLVVAGGMVRPQTDGGVAPAAPTDTVELYDPEANQWRDATPLPEPAMETAVFSAGERIYVLAGREQKVWVGELIEPDAPAKPTSAPPPAKRSTPIGWIVAGVVLAALAAGAVVRARGRSKR